MEREVKEVYVVKGEIENRQISVGREGNSMGEEGREMGKVWGELEETVCRPSERERGEGLERAGND